jgi:hypothetical protein
MAEPTKKPSRRKFLWAAGGLTLAAGTGWAGWRAYQWLEDRFWPL